MIRLYQLKWQQTMKVFVLLLTFQLTLAGDFALIADLFNQTIYAGSMGQALVDLTPLPLSGIKGPIAVDYDPVMEMVYWTDVQGIPTPKISRAHLNGSNQRTLVENLRLPDGLTLDTTSRMMYWTDMVLMHIMRATMDGENKEVIVENIGSPRAIVAHHLSGFIYWTDWGEFPKIERANLDGGNRTILVKGDLGFPNGIFIDHENNIMYWCDARLDKIERSDLLGNNRQVVKDLTQLLLPFHPFDLAVYKEEIYWTDWRYKAILRVNVNGLGEQVYGPLTFERAAGIHIQLEPDYCEGAQCVNGATCVDIINGYRCECPPGSTTCSQDSGCMLSRDRSDHVTIVPDKDVYLPGDHVAFTCPSGYRISGSNERFCRSDLTWSGEATACIAEDSGCMLSRDRSDSVTIEPDKDVYLPGDHAEFTCPSGYRISGSTERFCRSDLTWSGEATTCIAEDPGCTLATRDDLNDVVFVPDKDVYLAGDHVEFSCPNGYQLNGSTERICLLNSTWSGEEPHCVMDGEVTDEMFPLVPLVPVIGGGAGLFLIIILIVFAIICLSRWQSSNTNNPGGLQVNPTYVSPANPIHVYENTIANKPEPEVGVYLNDTTTIGDNAGVRAIYLNVI